MSKAQTVTPHKFRPLFPILNFGRCFYCYEHKRDHPACWPVSRKRWLRSRP